VHRTPAHSGRLAATWIALALVSTLAGCSSGSSDAGPSDGPGDPIVDPITDGAFLPEAGLLVVEFESLGASGGWASESALSGFTGSNYLRWAGANFFGSPGTDTFGADLWIAEAGVYQLRLHNRHEHPSGTEANDVWARMDGGDWVKTFSWQRGQWTWVTQHELGHGAYPDAAYTLDVGNHRIEFSGRSTDFCMDRFHLYGAAVANPLDTGHPESARHSVSGFTAPGSLVDVGELAADTRVTTLVTLDCGRSDGAPVWWRVPGARFVDGTHERSPRARVIVAGGAAVPVELRAETDAGTEVRRALLTVAGAALPLRGDLVCGGTCEVDLGPAEGPGEGLRVTSPSGLLRHVAAQGEGARRSARWALDEPGEWTIARGESGGVPQRLVVLP